MHALTDGQPKNIPPGGGIKKEVVQLLIKINNINKKWVFFIYVASMLGHCWLGDRKPEKRPNSTNSKTLLLGSA